MPYKDPDPDLYIDHSKPDPRPIITGMRPGDLVTIHHPPSEKDDKTRSGEVETVASVEAAMARVINLAGDGTWTRHPYIEAQREPTPAQSIVWHHRPAGHKFPSGYSVHWNRPR